MNFTWTLVTKYIWNGINKNQQGSQRNGYLNDQSLYHSSSHSSIPREAAFTLQAENHKFFSHPIVLSSQKNKIKKFSLECVFCLNAGRNFTDLCSVNARSGNTVNDSGFKSRDSPSLPCHRKQSRDKSRMRTTHPKIGISKHQWFYGFSCSVNSSTPKSTIFQNSVWAGVNGLPETVIGNIILRIAHVTVGLLETLWKLRCDRFWLLALIQTSQIYFTS